MKNRTFIIVSIIFLLMNSCTYHTNNSNLFEFDNIDSVSKTIQQTDTLLDKLQVAYTPVKLNYFKINIYGNIEINGVIINKIYERAEVDDSKKDSLFKNYSESEIWILFRNIRYLFKNHISMAIEDQCLPYYVYNYKACYNDEPRDQRMIIYLKNSKDTNTSNFRSTYTILETKNNLVLFKYKKNLSFYTMPPCE